MPSQIICPRFASCPPAKLAPTLREVLFKSAESKNLVLLPLPWNFCCQGSKHCFPELLPRSAATRLQNTTAVERAALLFKRYSTRSSRKRRCKSMPLQAEITQPQRFRAQ